MARLFTLLLALLSFGPLLCWLGVLGAVFVLGSYFDCPMNEGAVQPCLIGGLDIGETAGALFVFAAWGPLIFGPLSIGAGILWILLILLRAYRRRKGQ